MHVGLWSSIAHSTNCGPKEKTEIDSGIGKQIHGDSQIRAEAVDNAEVES